MLMQQYWRADRQTHLPTTSSRTSFHSISPPVSCTIVTVTLLWMPFYWKRECEYVLETDNSCNLVIFVSLQNLKTTLKIHNTYDILNLISAVAVKKYSLGVLYYTENISIRYLVEQEGSMAGHSSSVIHHRWDVAGADRKDNTSACITSPQSPLQV